MKNWKKYAKEGLFLLPAAALLLASVVGLVRNTPVYPELLYPEASVQAAEVLQETEEPPQAEAETESEAAVVPGVGDYEDGVYRGVGTGYAGDIEVEVTVEGGQIVSIEILRCEDDDAFFDKACALIDVILTAQTWEVDTVTGATYSSRGILEAVRNALTGSDEKSQAEASEEEKSVDTAVYSGGSDWKDGTYTGTGTGFGGPIVVQVTIENGVITDIQVTQHDGETPSYFEKAKGIISSILAAQDPNVDTITGATYSSAGIRSAVISALCEAAGEPTADDSDVESGKKTAGSKKSSRKNSQKKTNGTPADGTYTGSAVCERFGYTVSLKVKFQNGKAASISGLSVTGNTDSANEAYWTKAWKPMVKRILKAQSADVDVVTGATYSSNAIADAYLDARSQAIEANGGKTKKKKHSGSSSSDSSTSSDTSGTAPVLDDADGAEQPTGEIVDGTYRGSALCVPDEYNDFDAYTLSADVTFADGRLTDISNFKATDESNRTYYQRAVNGTARDAGIVAQLLEKQSASGISAVSGATCSSVAIRDIYLDALTQATGIDQTEEWTTEEETEEESEKAGEEESEDEDPDISD